MQPLTHARPAPSPQLTDSLSGDSKTLMFVNLSPVASSADESICSLNFAARCVGLIVLHHHLALCSHDLSPAVLT